MTEPGSDKRAAKKALKRIVRRYEDQLRRIILTYGNPPSDVDALKRVIELLKELKALKESIRSL